MNQMLNSAFQDKMDAILARVRVKFVEQLEGTAEGFRDCIGGLGDPAEHDAMCRDIRMRAHKLHGTAGMVGFSEIGRLSLDLDVFLAPDEGGRYDAGTAEIRARLDPLLDEIETQLRAG